MNRYYPNLFSPLKIKNAVFRNRIIMAPFLPQNADEHGLPSEYGMAYFERRARGGAAQLTVGETSVDKDRSCRKFDGGYNLTKDSYNIREECMMSELTLMMHQHRTIAAIELSHIGLWNDPASIKDHKNPVGPVAFVRPDGVSVDALDETMMNEIADNFAHASLNAKKFGFDSVVIHGGHGWLQSQFLSPLFNTRGDKYGGSLENRARFPVMIVDRVREAIGNDMLIEYRVSAEERVEGGITLEDTIAVLKMMEDKIDIVHVSVGCYQDPVKTRTFPSIYEKLGCNAELSAAIKKAVSVPVAVVGAINTPELAEEIIAEGKADFVVIAKQLLADPDFPDKAAAGRSGDIVPCLRCYRCMGGPGMAPNVICSVNPMVGREAREPFLQKNSPPRRVLVAGGGPAGMKAALTAAESGHYVTLFEASDELGGTIRFSDNDLIKTDLRRFKDYLISQTLKNENIEVRLSTRVSPELVREISPEVVIAAIGARPIAPPIPGLDRPNCLQATQAYAAPEKVGKKVVIIGGGLVGCEYGIHLRNTGRDVTIVEMGPVPAPECGGFPRMALEDQLASGVSLILNTAVTEVNESGVVAGGRQIDADTVICAAGMRALYDEAAAICAEADRSFQIGDCFAARKVSDAIHEGFFAARDI